MLAGLLLAACTTPPPPAQSPEGGSPTSLPKPTLTAQEGSEPATDPQYAAFYAQQLRWQGCGDSLECTTVIVPVDWAAPDGQTMDLAVVRLPATDQAARLGSLLTNPGGPGGSGVDYVSRSGEYVASPGVRRVYDLVGFDPRGVGKSDPVDCLSDAEMDDYLAFYADGSTDDGLARMTAEADRFAAACAADAGPLLAHLDTLSVARDLDVMRAALGDDHLTYLGRSYGTLIGAEYADLFPQRVGRLVLDGAVDPAMSSADVTLGQAAGMEGALRAYVTACLAGESGGDCPLRGDVETAVGQVRSVLELAKERPLRSDDGREVTATLAVLGIITPLYEDAIWYQLDEALAGALNGDGTGLLALADLYADRGPDGRYSSNLLEVISAVNCLDYPFDDDPADMRELAGELADVAPTVGPFLAYGDVLCGQWDAPPVREPGPVRAAGAAPILVVGTTGDPATPYAWAQALAGELESGRLLTYEGEGHTAYMRSGDCVNDAVDAYLIDGVLPGEGATC